MHTRIKKLTLLLVILSLVFVPCSTMASEEMSSDGYSFKDDQVEIGKMTTDALLVRPLGIAATAIGFGLFIVSVPFSALGGNTGDAWNALVAKPAEFTFKRPLGEFDD